MKTIWTIFVLLLVSCSSIKHKQAQGNKYIIATQGPYSSKAAKQMFDLGGNAFDAAVAASFVISVERPQSTGIGGGGFLVGLKAGDNIPFSYDFREKAPFKAHKNMYLNKKGEEIKGKSINGIHAAGVPGLVAGILEVHNKFGTLPLETVMKPSIHLASNGFKVYPELEKALKYRKDVLGKYPASKKIFFKNDKEVLKTGDLLIQKDLAKTLTIISKIGRDGFYKGSVAQAIINESKRLKGPITKKDLIKYNVKKRAPVKGSFRGHEIYSMAPPSSGGVHVIQILNILENYNLEKIGHGNAKSIHLTASAMQRAFADRATFLGDADFVKVPVDGLTSKKYAKLLKNTIIENKAKTSSDIGAGKPFDYESNETTHFTIADSKGNVVSSTQTINGYFGSAVTVPGTGIILNNEMDDFATKVGAKNLYGAIGGNKNLVEPEKRPLSSMSPTIVMKDGKWKMALGTPSGTRILTCVAQTILNYLEYKMDLKNAVAATRIHHQWAPDEIRIENPGFSSKVENNLKSMGYKINHKNLGCRIQALSNENNILVGVSDHRGEGLALSEK